METTEKRFEQDIETYFLNEGGFIKGDQSTYDKKRAIDMPVLLQFIQNTQQKVWQRYVNLYGQHSGDQLYKVFQTDVANYGLIHVLRNGIKDRGVHIKFCFFKPSSNLNQDLVDKYNANILQCTHQFSYSTLNHNTIDMVLSVNGIPIVALELKNQLTGQAVANGKHQFMYDRDPKELIFNFNTRILAYFALDLYEVAMTTHLLGDKTHFLPFNQGSNGAGNIGDGGNPENPNGYPTSYLWEKVLTREMLLSLMQRYISKITEEKIALVKGKPVKKKKTFIIFPRYHQLDVVEKIIADTKTSSSGNNYLLQHSAGSGKSNSIAWLTYRLASLHNEMNNEMFQTVFVVTDRRVLNSQLQTTILGFEHLEGQIETITDKDNSSKLKEAINNKKRIIITTLHRFPIIYKELDTHIGKNFAIIVDEAHSSQSGKSAEKLKAALADTNEALREMAEIEEKSEEEIKDDMDLMTETLLTQGQHKNLYFYAFTATPKPKTLETFGVRTEKGYDAFHHYSMRQAIDEGFILDVLQFYTTIENSYEIAKSIEDNPEYEEPPATRAVKAYHDNHEYVVHQIVEVMVEKFREITLHKIDGQAKAMVVSPSRAHAVRFYFAMKDYCKKKGYEDVNPLVAFSGTVKYNETEYTESNINSTEGQKITESKLPLFFASEMYNILIVADKYQTGFDEPLLHTMFVDKKLRRVKAVQTLSRLNRSYPGKNDTYILDFVNDTETIQYSFQPFYEDTLLEEGVDINMVYKYLNDIRQYHLWNVSDEEKVYQIYANSKQSSKDMGKLSSAFKNTMAAFENLTIEDKFKVRFLVRNFNRFYAYMAQIVRTFDKELYKTYVYTELLYKLLPKNPHEKVDLTNKIALINNKLTETFSGCITLEHGKNRVKAESSGQGGFKEEKRDLLTNIIDKINLMYAGQFTEADRVIVETIFDKMSKSNSSLKKQAKNTDEAMFTSAIFPKAFGAIAQQCYMESMDAFAKLFEDPQFYQRVMSEMAESMYVRLRGGK